MKLLWADVVPSFQSYITLATAALYSQQCSCFAHPNGIFATLNQRRHEWRTTKNQTSPEWAQIHTERSHQIRKPMHFLPSLHCPTSQTQCVRIHFSRFSCWLWSWGCDSLAANGFVKKRNLALVSLTLWAFTDMISSNTLILHILCLHPPGASDHYLK